MRQASIKEKVRIPDIFLTTVSVVGLMTLAYSAGMLALGSLNFEWVLLSCVTIMLVSRIDLGIPKTSGSVTLSDTFIFISVFLFGTPASVVLAGADAAICSIQHKNKRKTLWYNTAVMSLSVFVSSTVVTYIFGDLKGLAADLVKLVLAAVLLAVIHFALNSGFDLARGPPSQASAASQQSGRVRSF